MFFLDHIWLIPLLPVIGAACMFFFGTQAAEADGERSLRRAVVLAFVLSCRAVWQYTQGHGTGQPVEKVMYTWLGSDNGH